MIKINKKGNILNIPLHIGIIFIVVLGLIFSAFIFNRFDQITQSQGVFKEVNQSRQAIGNVRQTFENLDDTIFWVFLGFALLLIISSYLIRTSPIFVIFMIIFIVLCMILSFVVSQAYYEITLDAYLSNTTNSFSTTNNIMNNLPLYMGIVSFMALIALFAKPSSGGQV